MDTNFPLEPLLNQRWRQDIPPRHMYLYTKSHGVTLHKKVIFIFILCTPTNIHSFLLFPSRRHLPSIFKN